MIVYMTYCKLEIIIISFVFPSYFENDRFKLESNKIKRGYCDYPINYDQFNVKFISF